MDLVNDVALFKSRLNRRATGVDSYPKRVWYQGDYYVPSFIISEADEDEIIEKAAKEGKRRRLVERARRSVGSFTVVNGKRVYLSQPWRNKKK